ncbi:hypothetical protein MVEN_00406600 [Mycena venus]|uniref:Rho termination factor N-terminal domain-containing protein n=1 Tax=Mycena venus TaxID=2733690 RepID=A0A8H6YW06_9AGAR|nr:hypothetical protein MVEN_00406600 [Mycena venus]
MQTESELKKLTVPQLKSLCKERRITGYSKLGKDAIIHKLLGIATPAAPTSAQAATPAPENNTTVQTLLPSPPTPDPPSSRPSLPTPALPDAPIPAQSSSLNPTPDTSTSARTNVKSAPKSRPKKAKNPPASQSSQSTSDAQHPSSSTLTASSPTTSQLILAADTSIPAHVDAKSAPKPRPKKRKNPPSARGDAWLSASFPSFWHSRFFDVDRSSYFLPTSSSTPDTEHSAPHSDTTSSTLTAPSPPDQMPDASTSQPAPPDTSTSARVVAEPALKPRPKKRKNPLTSQDSLPTESSPSDHVFKVPALPQRLTQDFTSTPASTATTLTSSAASSSKKKKKAADKFTASTSDSSSTAAAPKKRKTVPTSSDVIAIPVLPIVNTSTRNIPSTSATEPPPKITKRPSGLVPIDAPPTKKQKVSSLLPTSDAPVVSKNLLPKPAAPPIHSTVVFQDVVTLPQPKPKRFVPLSVPRPCIIWISPAFPPSPSLTPITLPPKKSERKHVPRLSLLLSSVADEDLRNCVFASRVFRYAVYLSASSRLARDFAGKRLSLVLAKYPQATTNMWPYLKLRRQEVSSRKLEYSASFLGRVLPFPFSGGTNNTCPISERLWCSPDHERQIVIALRFLLARLFFQVSVGGSGKDGKGWNEGQIVDAQELVKDEVWAITVRRSASSTESFYVLEPTCEPLTAIPNSTGSAVPVRADWAAYIAHRTSSASIPVPRLLDCLSWTNHEEYERGISRLWLKRMEGEGATGQMKRVVAERYILACVVANSLSGRYMSATQMAQDFAGLPDVVPVRVAASPKVNLFLPAHHHVESLHFTASSRALHDALAIVQTPGRIYYVLRDNGMQVGCEEEGVAEIWMDILGCDNAGVTVAARK